MVSLAFLLLVVAGCKGVLAALPHSRSTASCVIDSDNHCRAVCGDVVLDISEVFTYPVKTSTSSYDYVFSPCNTDNTYCIAVGEPGTAVCQVDIKSTEHLNYSVGLKDKMEWTLIQAEPYIFTISYTGSIENRKVNVTFYEKSSMSEAKFLFTGEAPSATYNFEVKGKHIGQPSHINAEQCVVDQSNPCVATCNGEKFNITHILKYPVKAHKNGYRYIYSPCTGGFECGDVNDSAVCQQIDDEENFSLGSVASMVWWLNQSTPYYIFSIEYDHGDNESTYYRISRVRFVQDKTIHNATFHFLDENVELVYNFEIRGSDVGQPGGSNSGCTADPSNPCKLRCNGSEIVDISDVFNYPISTLGEKPNQTYTYNPCTGSLCGCPERHIGAAACEFAPVHNYSLGQVTNISWTLVRTHPYLFSIEYRDGDREDCDGDIGNLKRKSRVTFREDPSSDINDASFTFLEENPKLTFNFEVKGVFVGQKASKYECMVDPRTPCVATCSNNIRIDLSKIFSNPITIVGPNGNFIFSPCVGYNCGSPAKNSSVCLGGEDSYGQLSSVKWTLTQTQPYYIFTVTYTAAEGSTQQRSTVFTFVENSAVHRMIAVYAGSLSESSHLFDVVGPCVGQSSCTDGSNGMKADGLLVEEVSLVMMVFVVVVLILLVAIATIRTRFADKPSAIRKDVHFTKLA